jgi:8-oxo-dGTP pyrophosphatase MutT (NUDIX family)
MNERIWKPNATVAAIIERDGKFLLVEEETDDGIRYNQPAGHLDDGESLPEACARETLEETAWRFEPTELVGIYQWGPASKPDLTYLRFAFAGTLGVFEEGRTLDEGIICAVWKTPAEIEADQALHRSPLVWRCVQDYLSGRRYPLDLIRYYGKR